MLVLSTEGFRVTVYQYGGEGMPFKRQQNSSTKLVFKYNGVL